MEINQEEFEIWLSKNTIETFCMKCKKGFDEDSEECFRCNSKDVVHKVCLNREELLELVKSLTHSCSQKENGE